jgi:hypothetical protein
MMAKSMPRMAEIPKWTRVPRATAVKLKAVWSPLNWGLNTPAISWSGRHRL